MDKLQQSGENVWTKVNCQTDFFFWFRPWSCPRLWIFQQCSLVSYQSRYITSSYLFYYVYLR